jgi:hypothetical protein
MLGLAAAAVPASLSPSAIQSELASSEGQHYEPIDSPKHCISCRAMCTRAFVTLERAFTSSSRPKLHLRDHVSSTLARCEEGCMVRKAFRKVYEAS